MIYHDPDQTAGTSIGAGIPHPARHCTGYFYNEGKSCTIECSVEALLKLVRAAPQPGRSTRQAHNESAGALNPIPSQTRLSRTRGNQPHRNLQDMCACTPNTLQHVLVPQLHHHTTTLPSSKLGTHVVLHRVLVLTRLISSVLRKQSRPRSRSPWLRQSNIQFPCSLNERQEQASRRTCECGVQKMSCG
jgi:hypothetical protein